MSDDAYRNIDDARILVRGGYDPALVSKELGVPVELLWPWYQPRDPTMEIIAEHEDTFLSHLPLHRAAFDLGYTERDLKLLKSLRITP